MITNKSISTGLDRKYADSFNFEHFKKEQISKQKSFRHSILVLFILHFLYIYIFLDATVSNHSVVDITTSLLFLSIILLSLMYFFWKLDKSYLEMIHNALETNGWINGHRRLRHVKTLGTIIVLWVIFYFIYSYFNIRQLNNIPAGISIIILGIALYILYHKSSIYYYRHFKLDYSKTCKLLKKYQSKINPNVIWTKNIFGWTILVEKSNRSKYLIVKKIGNSCVNIYYYPKNVHNKISTMEKISTILEGRYQPNISSTR